VITAPFMFDDLFAWPGASAPMMSNSSRSILYRIFNPEGRAFNYNGDETFILDQIRQWNPADV